MKHIFIVNPAAGRKDRSRKLTELIKSGAHGTNFEIYQTRCAGDATRFVSEYCKQYNGPVRFYGCGGDGTLNEIVNGMVGCDNAALGCIPCGSGNDFVKYYGGAEHFMSIENLICGEERSIDLMKVDDKYCVNVCDFGFDAFVTKTMYEVKHHPILGGGNAYTTGVVKALTNGMQTPCRIFVDGEEITSGNILLCTIANGRYVGGSFQCAPRALNDDGQLEVCLMNPVSRTKFLTMAGAYQKGTHIDDPRFANGIMSYRRGRRVTVEGGEGFVYILDGEIISKPKFTVEIAESAVRFVVPVGAQIPGAATSAPSVMQQ